MRDRKVVHTGKLGSLKRFKDDVREVREGLECGLKIAGYDDIKVTFKIDADASKKDIEAIVAQSQKRSAVYDVITNPVNVTVEVV